MLLAIDALNKNQIPSIQDAAKYGIVEQDIYNFDETGFSIGMTSTAKVCPQ